MTGYYNMPQNLTIAKYLIDKYDHIPEHYPTKDFWKEVNFKAKLITNLEDSGAIYEFTDGSKLHKNINLDGEIYLTDA